MRPTSAHILAAGGVMAMLPAIAIFVMMQRFIVGALTPARSRAERDRRARLLAWEDCLNARDLGGYRTADGRETRWGAIVRSDDLSALTPTGRDSLVEHGIRSIVDLRTPAELGQSPNPFARPSDHDVEYINLSFEDPAAHPSWPDFAELADEYEWMLHRFEPRVAGIMAAIARAPEGGVLVHCVYGQDRTGLVCAMMLDLAGVDRETIGEDYALSGAVPEPAQRGVDADRDAGRACLEGGSDEEVHPSG